MCKAKLINKYENDTDFVICVVQFSDVYKVIVRDLTGSISDKCIAKSNSLEEARRIAKNENRQYYFE